VYQICLQTQRTKECAEAIEPLGCSAEHAIKHHYQRNGKWDVYHSLYKQRESTMSNLLQIEARTECGKEQEQNHPDACSVNLCLSPYQLATVYANKEYWYATPEYLYMSQSLMQRYNPLYPDTPQNH
jgi:hypothetical protein